jgi:hypothetical protein
LTQWRLRGKGYKDLPGAVKGPVYIGHVHERVELLGLLARQDEGLDAEDLAYGVEPLILLQPLLVKTFIYMMYKIFALMCYGHHLACVARDPEM